MCFAARICASVFASGGHSEQQEGAEQRQQPQPQQPPPELEQELEPEPEPQAVQTAPETSALGRLLADLGACTSIYDILAAEGLTLDSLDIYEAEDLVDLGIAYDDAGRFCCTPFSRQQVVQ